MSAPACVEISGIISFPVAAIGRDREGAHVTVRVRPGHVDVKYRLVDSDTRRYSRWITILVFDHEDDRWTEPGFGMFSEAGRLARAVRAAWWDRVTEAGRRVSPERWPVVP